MINLKIFSAIISAINFGGLNRIKFKHKYKKCSNIDFRYQYMYYNNARRSMYHTLAVSHQLKFRHLRVLFCIRFSARRVAPKSLISYFCRWISSMEVFTWKY